MANKGIRKGFKVFTGFAAILGFGLGLLSFMVLWKGENVKVFKNSSENLITIIASVQNNGGRIALSEGDLNGFVEKLLKEPVTRGNVTINDVYVEIADNELSFYTKLRYKFLDLLLITRGKLTYEDERVVYSVSSVSLGKLPLPKGIVFNIIKKYSNEDMIIEDNNIKISKYLLPFNAKDIYIEDNFIIVEIEKFKYILMNEEEGKITSDDSSSKEEEAPQQQGSPIAGSTPKGTENTIKNSNKPASSSVKTVKNQEVKQTESKTPTKVESSKSLEARENQVSYLKQISSQLNGVIEDVTTVKEKQMMRKIQTVVNSVAKDPGYHYQSEARDVKAWFWSLSAEEKTRVKNAILNNVDVVKILKLINIFGV